MTRSGLFSSIVIWALLVVPVRQGAVTGGVGVVLGAVEADRAEPGGAVGLGNQQNLHEEPCELFTKTAAEGGQGVVVGWEVAGEITEGDGIVGGEFDATAGEYPPSRSHR